MTPLNDVTTRVDAQEAWFWWICEKARGSSNLRGLSVEHAVAMSYELAALHITPETETPAPETLPKRVRVVKSSGPKFWYAKCIGDEFEVTGSANSWNNKGDPGYWVINPSDPKRIEHYVIDVADCVPAPDTLATLQARLKLADDLVREFVLDLRVLTPQQAVAWEKWNTSTETLS